MTTILKERSPWKDVLIQTGGDVQADADVDLGAMYEKVIIKATATEAANMAAASTLSLLVDDEEVYDDTGTLITIDKPAANAGIHFVANVEAGRLINIVLSATPTADVTFQVQGVGRLVIDEAAREFAKNWTI